MNIGTKITEIRKEKKMNLSQLADLSGVSVSTLKKISAGITKDPQIDTLKSIAKALDCTLEDFDERQTVYTVEERQFLSDYKELDTHGQKIVNFIIKEELERIRTQKAGKQSTQQFAIHYSVPYYDLPVSAGTGEFLDSEYYTIAELAEEPPQGTNFIVRVSGDSMEPTYHNGDKLFVKQQQSVNIGEVGIFMIDGDVYVKELAEDCLISHNKKYNKIPFHEYNNIRCYGKVLGICTEDI